MKEDTFSENSSLSGGQGIPFFLCNLKVHQSVHVIPPLLSTSSNPDVPKIPINIVTVRLKPW
jgi:hypothetical protein